MGGTVCCVAFQRNRQKGKLPPEESQQNQDEEIIQREWTDKNAKDKEMATQPHTSSTFYVKEKQEEPSDDLACLNDTFLSSLETITVRSHEHLLSPWSSKVIWH